MDFANIVATVGFPIAACGFMGWYCKYTIDKFMGMVGNIEQKYSVLIKDQQEVVANNTEALAILTERISYSLKEAPDNGDSE